MKTLTTLALASAFGLATVGAQAAETFGGLTWGHGTSNIQSSSALKQNLGHPKFDNVIRHSNTWGLRLGQQNDERRYYATYEYISDNYSNSLKLRQQNLLGSYDAFLPLRDSTRLFGGATLGLIKLEQESKGYRRDSDIGYAAGLQAGIIQDLAANLALEGGYRYLRSNASTEVGAHGGAKLGSIDLHSTKQAYLGLNYNF
jgi:opacity protein-like surface antigen